MSSPPPTTAAPPNPPLEVPSIPAPPSSRFVLPPPPSALLSRLNAFLPQIKAANEMLTPPGLPARDGTTSTPPAEAVTLVPVVPKPAKAPKMDVDSNASTEESSDSSDSDSESESEGEEIVLVNLGEDALPQGIEDLNPIVGEERLEAQEGVGADGERLAGLLNIGGGQHPPKAGIVEME